MKLPIASILVGLPLLHATASGAVLFADTFDRSDSRNIQESLIGITNNTGTAFEAGGDPSGTPVYRHGHIDPLSSYAGGFGAPGGTPEDGASARVVTNGIVAGSTLELASEVPGTSNAIINHNFVNASILAAGGFSVSFDAFSRGGNSNGNGVGFALGMSLAEATGTGDAFNGASRLTGGLGTSIGGGTIASQVASDFWIMLRSNGSLAWGAGAGTVGIFGVPAGQGIPQNPSGNIKVNFWVDSFDAGSTVNYEVFYDETSRGTGTFNWSGTGENYIGLEGRNGDGVNIDNLAIQTIPEPAATFLGLIGAFILPRRRR